jgi:hypothetical protein
VSPEEVQSEAEQLDQVRDESGAGHRDDTYKKLSLKKPMPPRCAGCKRFMGYNDGMYIIVAGDWRLHIKCFEKVVERHFEDGEVLDLTTGQIVKIDPEEDNS